MAEKRKQKEQLWYNTNKT